MQEKLDKLSAFCTDWCLDINIKKTKILVLNKAGKHLSHKFVFQNNDHDGCLPSYTFLIHLYAALRSGKDESKF
jgi:hypothetical protein